MPWHPYKWRFCCFVTHILEILPFMVCKSNLRGMGFRSLIVSTGGSSEDSSSALLDLCLWELCFSPSLPFMGVMLFPSFEQGNVSEGGRHTSCAAFSVFYSSFSFSPFFSPSFPLFFHIFSLLFFLPHKLLPSFFFFFCSEGTACTVSFQDVTTDCN